VPLREEIKHVMHELGLNAYEIEAYSALLEGGQLTASEVSSKGKVPYSKIYDVLNSLRDKGWIKSVEGRPSRHYPLPPIEALAAAKLRLEDKYKGWEQAITNELQPLYEKRELVEQSSLLILRGQQAVMAKLEEIFRKARKEAVIAAPEFAKTVIATASVFLEVLHKTRIDVKLMVAGRTEDWKKLEGLAAISEMRVRDQMFGGGIIIDEKEAILLLGEEKPSLVIWSNHVGLVRFAREYFQFLWDSSKKIQLKK